MIEVADDIVNLSDEDNALEITETHYMKKIVRTGNPDIIETIDLDQLPSPQASRQSNNSIIDLCNGVHKNNKEQSHTPNSFQGKLDNPLLVEFIEKCLNLDNSKGMSRIIDNILMRIYNEVEQEYKYSRQFQRVLLKAVKCMDCAPDHKFAHLRNLCETMKQHQDKKLVNSVTLHFKKDRIKRHSSEIEGKQSKKRKINIIIDSDDEQQIPVINLEDDHDQNDLIENNLIELDINGSSESDNLLKPQFEVYWNPNIVDNLEPPVSPDQPQGPSEDNKVKIKELETEIAFCKRQITMYDEEEVDLDSTSSSYIKSEKLKERVVFLYKVLCDLTGHSPVKRRKVKLKVLEGHPTEPVKKLEKFLNDIGTDGAPPFPDFNDVLKCVTDANVESSLCWTKQEILKEATALFVYSGKELQRQRQQREYKYLLSHINQEQHDPADDDPELCARLDANRRIAEKKVSDVFERYATIQSLCTRKPTPNPPPDLNGPIQTNFSDPDTNSETEDDSDTDSDNEDIEKDTSNGIILENHIPVEDVIDTAAVAEVTAKTETVVSAENQNTNNELRMGTELTKPLEIDAITVNAETISNCNSNNIAVNNNLQMDVPIEDARTENTGSIGKVVTNADPIIELEIDAITVNAETISNCNSINIAVNNNFQMDVPVEDARTESTGSIGKVVTNEGKADRPITELEIDAITVNAETISNCNSTNIAVNNNLQMDVLEENTRTENTESIGKVVANEDKADRPRKELEINAITVNAVTISNCNSTNIAVNNHLQMDVPVEDTRTENTGSIGKVLANEDHKADGPKKEFEIDTNSELIGAIQLKTEMVIKQEPEEIIIKKLEDLREDYTVSVLDIEDPFISIEISDSSEDDGEYLNSSEDEGESKYRL